MIVLDVKQGSPEWHAARTGIPTASQFHRILSAKTRKPSASAEKYMCELVAERLLRQPLESGDSAFMLRGSELEKRAVTAYEFDHDVDTTPVGFVLRDDRKVGCSPDRLVGERGLLEIKCVCARDHVAALLGILGDEHAAQVQGQLWLTERDWEDLLYYNPDMPPALIHVERDNGHIAQLEQALDAFIVMVDAALLTIEKLIGKVAA